MGIDGNQYVYVRGPKECLDEMEARGLRMDDPENPESDYVGTHQYFFGKENVKVLSRKPNYLVCKLAFRNDTIFEQMELLLNKYTKCWFKNEFETEDGDCGVWVGRYHNGKPYIQVREWTELMEEEIAHETDFSRVIE